MVVKPDFDSIILERVNLPYDAGRLYVRARYSDPLLAGWEATMIEDTTNISGERLVTAIWRFPRVVLSEINTHRVFSRNSASSRARSVSTTILDVLKNPYVPLFTKNQKGMSGRYLETLNEWEEAKRLHLYGRDNAVRSTLALLLGEKYIDRIKDADSDTLAELVNHYHQNVYLGEENGLSVHKQVANRALEPYMWHESVVTSSYWNNFIRLRVSSAADPAVYAIALLHKALLDASHSRENSVHLPFGTEDMIGSINGTVDDMPILMECASNAAQISYVNKSENTSTTGSVNLGYRLKDMEHWSPFEHIAYDAVEYCSLAGDNMSGNLHPSWVQLRCMLDTHNHALGN